MTATGQRFDESSDIRTFEKGRVEVVTVGAFTFGRYEFQPGWRWSEAVKPLAGTDLCEVHHAGVILSGTLHVAPSDGPEQDVTAGTACEVQPGHDAWVVGDEPVRAVEFLGAAEYAKKA